MVVTLKTMPDSGTPQDSKMRLPFTRTRTEAGTSRSGSSSNSKLLKVVGVLTGMAMLLQIVNYRGMDTASKCQEFMELHMFEPSNVKSQEEPATATPPPPMKPLPRSNLTQSTMDFFPLPRTTTESNVVVMVLSRRSTPEVRQAIRDTWGKGHDNVFFVIGQGCSIPTQYRDKDEGGNVLCRVAPRVLDDKYMPKTLEQIRSEQDRDQLLLQEQAKFQDLLLMDAVDVYRTLPHKLKFAYTFVDQHLSDKVHWVLKVDDDFFVRIPQLQDWLKQRYDEQNLHEKPILLSGDIRREHTAHVQGKWKEVPQFPRGRLYPPFPLGSFGHIATRPIVRWIAEHQQALFDYQGEDVSIGIWLNHPLAPKDLLMESVPVLKNNGNCRPSTSAGVYVVGHDVTPAKMKYCMMGAAVPATTNALHSHLRTTGVQSVNHQTGGRLPLPATSSAKLHTPLGAAAGSNQG